MNIVYIRQNWKSLSDGNFVMNKAGQALTSRCALGRNGITSRKREGDGATPIGTFNALKVYYRADRIARPITRLPIEKITKKHGWCDESNDRNYNKIIELPYPKSHEVLSREDHLYDLMVVLDYNISTRKRGAGSAIFFHLAHHDYRPTEGCIAVNEKVMRRFLLMADSTTKFLVMR